MDTVLAGIPHQIGDKLLRDGAKSFSPYHGGFDDKRLVFYADHVSIRQMRHEFLVTQEILIRKLKQPSFHSSSNSCENNTYICLNGEMDIENAVLYDKMIPYFADDIKPMPEHLLKIIHLGGI